MELYPREIWKHINGYKNFTVSTHGRVFNTKLKTYLEPHMGGEYPAVTLTENGVSKQKKVHRIVLETFNSVVPIGKTVAHHIDNNKHNFNINNLMWVTISENTLLAFKDGMIPDKHDITKKQLRVSRENAKRSRRSVRLIVKETGEQLDFDSARDAGRWTGYHVDYVKVLINRYGGENSKFIAYYTDNNGTKPVTNKNRYYGDRNYILIDKVINKKTPFKNLGSIINYFVKNNIKNSDIGDGSGKSYVGYLMEHNGDKYYSIERGKII